MLTAHLPHDPSTTHSTVTSSNVVRLIHTAHHMTPLPLIPLSQAPTWSV